MKTFKMKIENKFVYNMLRNNLIDGIIPYVIDDNYIIYDIYGLNSLGDFFKNSKSTYTKIEIIMKICKVIKNLENYMLSENLFFDIKNIYLTQNKELVYMLNMEESQNFTFDSLLKSILFSSEIEDEKFLEINFKINNLLIKSDNPVDDLISLLDRYKNKEENRNSYISKIKKKINFWKNKSVKKD